MVLSVPRLSPPPAFLNTSFILDPKFFDSVFHCLSPSTSLTCLVCHTFLSTMLRAIRPSSFAPTRAFATRWSSTKPNFAAFMPPPPIKMIKSNLPTPADALAQKWSDDDPGHDVQGPGHGKHTKRTLASLSMDGKVCVVTGAGRGLGNMMARTFVESYVSQSLGTRVTLIY